MSREVESEEPTRKKQQREPKRQQQNSGCKLLSKKFRAEAVDVPPAYDLSSVSGLRKVAPYDYVFSCYSKGRWLNRTILDVFSSEFNYFRNVDFYRYAIEAGVVKINGESVMPEYVIQNSDLVETSNHRHEPPVTS